MTNRHYTPVDRLLQNVDTALRTLFGHPLGTHRPYPAEALDEVALDEQERRHVAALMRINHTGEVCAQALYQGQALTAQLPETRQRMERSAREENDHLVWCMNRIDELQGRGSLLNPLFFAGSFAIGAAAGWAGDRWSLGFVVETERQVEEHLTDHLDRVPERDERTRAILEQMKVDEVHHAQVAKAAGATPLPAPLRSAMRLASQVMTRSVYWL
ncbi:2-polyprenyl-3-methyl-6-methoxy-1,4-benzoquinone monooxygenase [uncultured Thiodictyon sp.]|uniref:2-polyprenyl-3-methyl-6-methoxy-1,4-benzoquinone monooxygenase n=1 Tax=uncultured Thiodictyon sp. TaxID=1846217 RepID=UPI0025CD77BA|nr:2-polyprenyl-3-methyl-6-methoxy-1,4-benzoquinone monooxygenase [uncultured Thiodictyon sp.]